MSDWIRFEENKPITVTLKDIDVEEKDNNFGGSQYDWNINPLDSGEIKFSASASLNEKMIALQLSVGDSITIEKVKKPEVFNGKPFFKVEMAQNPPTTTQDKVVMDQHATGEIKAVEPTQKDDSMAIHELTIRIEALESEVLKLKKDALPF